LVLLRFEFTLAILRRKIRGLGLFAVMAVTLLPAAPNCPYPAAKIAQKIFVGAYWRSKPEFVAAGFFVERHFDYVSGALMVENVRGFHVQQNLQRAATTFEKAAITPLY
jgi:hypothetical protein